MQESYHLCTFRWSENAKYFAVSVRETTCDGPNTKKPSTNELLYVFIFVLVMRADSPDDIDRLSFHLPMFKEMGDQVQMEVTPLRSYAGLATDLKQRVNAGDEAIFEDIPTVPKAGLFYWVTFNIEYPGKVSVSGVSV